MLLLEGKVLLLMGKGLVKGEMYVLSDGKLNTATLGDVNSPAWRRY